jgi:hypothetical protein
MPLFRWVRDLGRPRVAGAYDVRHSIVRITERDLSAAEAALKDGQVADAVFLGAREASFGGYRLGSIVFTIFAAPHVLHHKAAHEETHA